MTCDLSQRQLTLSMKHILCGISHIRVLGCYFSCKRPGAACCKDRWGFGAYCILFGNGLLSRSVWIPCVQSQKDPRNQKTPGSHLTCIRWVHQVPCALRVLQANLKSDRRQQQQGNPCFSSQSNKSCCWGRQHWVNLKSTSGTQGKPGSASICSFPPWHIYLPCGWCWWFVLPVSHPCPAMCTGGSLIFLVCDFISFIPLLSDI